MPTTVHPYTHCPAFRAADPRAFSQHVSQKAVRWVLHMQQALLDRLRREGVLTARDEELLLQELGRDCAGPPPRDGLVH